VSFIFWRWRRRVFDVVEAASLVTAEKLHWLLGSWEEGKEEGKGKEEGIEKGGLRGSGRSTGYPSRRRRGGRRGVKRCKGPL
jgi:hypothetical protein